MPRVRWGVCVLAAAAVLAGCGGDTDPALSAAQARDLLERLDRARAAAAAGNVGGVEEALAGFRGRVARLRRAGRLDDPTARALRIGASRVLERAREDAAQAAPVEPAPLPPPAAADEGERGKDEDNGKGRGKRKGKGKKGDDGGDGD